MIESDEEELIQGKILHKLGRFKKYGARHTAIENLYHYFPRHAQDQAKKTVEKLVCKRFFHVFSLILLIYIVYVERSPR